MKSGELFAGVGGLARAVEDVFDAETAWFAEIEDAPARVLAHHWPGVPNLGDVTSVDFAEVEPVRVLAGGFPCTDVSLAGRRAGMREGTRSGLWSEFARAIDAIRPDWVVIENVQGLYTASAAGDVEPCPWCLGDGADQYSLRALDAVLADLAALGFDAEWVPLRASDVGAPHGRLRVFILAWPAANTRDGAGDGERAREEPRTGGPRAGLTLLPTPVASSGDHGGPGRTYGDGSPTLDGIGRLLPTPVAQPSGNTAEEHLRKKPGRAVVTDLSILVESGLLETGGRLLPTPGAYDGDRGGSQHPEKRRDGGHSITLQDAAEHLLPTPQVADGMGGHKSRSGARQGERLLPGIAEDLAMLPTPRASRGAAATETMYKLGAERDDEGDRQGNVTGPVAWGDYEPAVRRWEAVLGRPAPPPVRMDGKGGKARLNAELPEWMMGWPAGWVTDPEIGLSRSEQLKACGNGVVTLQAAAALRHLLSRPGVPAIREDVAA